MEERVGHVGEARLQLSLSRLDLFPLHSLLLVSSPFLSLSSFLFTEHFLVIPSFATPIEACPLAKSTPHYPSVIALQGTSIPSHQPMTHPTLSNPLLKVTDRLSKICPFIMPGKPKVLLLGSIVQYVAPHYLPHSLPYPMLTYLPIKRTLDLELARRHR